MKAICTFIAVSLITAGTAALAQDSEPAQVETATPKAEVIARDDNGKATRVAIEGREYALCSESVKDSCISPRAAGFDWGTQPLDHWPGRTATSLRKAREEGASASQDASENAGADAGEEGPLLPPKAE